MAVTLGLTQWYAIAIAIFVGILATRLLGSHGPVLFALCRIWFLRHILYATLPRQYFRRISRFHALIVGLYIVANGFCMGLGIRSTSDLILRSGTMTSINLIPLFLGGRTNTLSNFLGISLHTYYLAHHWIGRVVIVQGLLHVALVVAAGQPWTFDSFQISGISAASAIALIMFTSFYCLRKLMFEFFLKLHLILGMVVIIALLKHSSRNGLAAAVFPITSIGLWAGNALVRLIRISYYNWSSKNFQRIGQAVIIPFFDQSKRNPTALRLTVKLRRLMQIRPGSYAYLFLSDMGIRRRFQAHPFVIAWWDDSLRATELSFLIQCQSGISADLISRNTIRSVTIDGPYGKDLHLDNYETVLLIAEGVGITGLLPYVKHIAYRRLTTAQHNDAYRRALITSKIDVFWILNDDCQQDWVSDWIEELNERDKNNIVLTFSCFYPHEKKRDSPVKNDGTYWRFIYNKPPMPIITELVDLQIARSAGRVKIAVCGTSEFRNTIRKTSLDMIAKYQDVEFAELEFQPQGVRQGHPGIHTGDEREVEGLMGGKPDAPLRSKLRSSRLVSEQQRNGTRRREALLRSQGGQLVELTTLEEELDTAKH